MRPLAAASGGYYPTPARLVPLIGGMLRLDHKWTLAPASWARAPFDRELAVVDPCAADGAAVFGVVKAMLDGAPEEPVRYYLAEMENSRCRALEQALRKRSNGGHERSELHHGDAFRVRWEREHHRVGASLLYLNPPYDSDPRYGRLEERWLSRFANTLAMGGVLVLVVPFYALSASAQTLGTHFAGLRCFRFPDPEFDAFKQVVLFAKKRSPLLASDPSVVAQVGAWAADASTIPVLPEAGRAIMTVPTLPHSEGAAGFSAWELAPLDVDTIAADWKPWRMTGKERAVAGPALRLIPGVLPENGVDGMKAQTFTVAMPLGPGHVAPAVACNVFDGIRLDPDDAASGLPPILLAARFRRNWVTTNERHNADGEKIAEEQVQQPSLVMVALDLKRGTYHRMANSVARRSATDLSAMTTADVIAAYSKALLSTLQAQCPALHDPAAPAEGTALPVLARPLFPAQAEVVLAVVQLLDTVGAALVLGETGTGKSTVATAIMVARGARRVLVICPPHLLDTWRDEVTANYPAARIAVLDDIAQAEAFARTEVADGGLLVGVLAETSGKLSHAWAGVGDPSVDAAPAHVDVGPEASPEQYEHRTTFVDRWTPTAGAWHRRAWRCPACGTTPENGHADIARRRLRCEAKPVVAKGYAGELVLELAEMLLPVAPGDARIADLCRRPGLQRLVKAWTSPEAMEEPARRDRAWTALLESGRAHDLAWRLSGPLRVGGPRTHASQAIHRVVGRLLVAIGDDALTARIAGAIYRASLAPGMEVYQARYCRDDARTLMILMRPGSDEQSGLAMELFGLHPDPSQYGDQYGNQPWPSFAEKVATLLGARTLGFKSEVHWGSLEAQRLQGRVIHYGNYCGEGGFVRGDRAAALNALEELADLRLVTEGPACGEPLFQAVPRPRRVPICTYLAKRHWDAVDLVVLDEAHEYGNPDSAITLGMQQWRGKPMVGLTGSVSNGKAASLFAILHTMSPAFREEFARNEQADFVRKYGYRRRVLEERTADTKRPLVFGTQSDRVERTARDIGDAPGALPSLILRHVLAVATVLHLDDLCIHLPPLVERVEFVDPGEPLGRDVRRLRGKLVDQIKADHYTAMSGKLFGQMGEEWSSADRASLGIGNTDEGVYRVSYPESVGGGQVAELPARPPGEALPKEQRMLEILAEEFAEGRNVLVTVWHSECGLPHRIAKLIAAHTGEVCPVLDANKVTAKKRDAWLRREVVAKGRRVLVVNPAAVETGLNSLVHFSTILEVQPPGCNPKAERQLRGRVRRPGQKKEQRIIRLLYKGTSQILLDRLLTAKVGESMAVDGLDPTATLRASGVGVVEGMTGFDVGRELFRLAREEMGPAFEA